MERLIICKKCGGDLAYENTFENNFKTTNCMGCGFSSNSMLSNGSDYQNQYEETLPELYKDLKFIDLDNKAWYPIVLNYPNKGMLFAEGTSDQNWGWTALLATKIEDNEKEKFKKPGVENEYFEYKMDAKTKRHFHKSDYISGVAYLGLFKEE